MYGPIVRPVSPGCIPRPRAGKSETRGAVSKSCRATASPLTPRRFRSQRICRTGIRFESESGGVTAVVTPSIAFTLVAMWSIHDCHAFHSASWSRFIHISTAMSIPIDSSLPTL